MEDLLNKERHRREGEQRGAQPASHRFSVAPMLDYTDRHFRVLMRQITTRSLLYTEMVVAQALHHARREPGAERPGGRLERLIGFDPCERPLALQVGGDDPDLLADAARLAADWGYDEINLNVGCPSEKVQKGRFGACLMAEPEQVARCVAAMAAASPLPVTVKHRIGIDGRDSYAELLAFVDTLASAGCQRFAVHARKAWLEGLDPKQNRTIPPLRYDLVHRLKAERPPLTIELNGGLQTLDECLAQLERLDGVMVGRAVYDHPLRWAAVDRLIHGESEAPGSESHLAMAARVVRGLKPYAEGWLARGDRLWPIARTGASSSPAPPAIARRTCRCWSRRPCCWSRVSPQLPHSYRSCRCGGGGCVRPQRPSQSRHQARRNCGPPSPGSLAPGRGCRHRHHFRCRCNRHRRHTRHRHNHRHHPHAGGRRRGARPY
jgi:tRNA-dihydrouridine synthase A